MGRLTRVLHFTTNAASSRYFRTIADNYDRERYEVSVGTLSPDGELHQELRAYGVSTFALGYTARSHYLWAAVRLAGWLRRRAVDVIQTHLFDAGVVGLVAARLAGTPLAVLTRHHSTAVVLTGKALPVLIDRICSRWLAHRVIAVSDVTRRFIVEAEKVPSRHVGVVPYSIDLGQYRSAPDARPRLKGEFGLDGRVVAVVGRLDPLKGHDVLLRALSRVLPSHPDCSLLVIGDGPERGRLESLRDALGLHAAVRFLGFRRDVPDLLDAADVLVHPSLSEAFCQVLMEAAACGKPIVTTDIGGAREVVEDRANGVIVPPGDEAALAAGIDALLRVDVAERDRMGARGRERVRRFTPRAMVEAYEANYVRWLAERGAA